MKPGELFEKSYTSDSFNCMTLKTENLKKQTLVGPLGGLQLTMFLGTEKFGRSPYNQGRKSLPPAFLALPAGPDEKRKNLQKFEILRVFEIFKYFRAFVPLKHVFTATPLLTTATMKTDLY